DLYRHLPHDRFLQPPHLPVHLSDVPVRRHVLSHRHPPGLGARRRAAPAPHAHRVVHARRVPGEPRPLSLVRPRLPRGRDPDPHRAFHRAHATQIDPLISIPGVHHT